MTAIAITDCTVTTLLKTTTFKVVKIVTPATAADGDTIDVSTLFTTGCISICSGATDKTDLVNEVEYTDRSITIPDATTEAKTIIAFGE